MKKYYFVVAIYCMILSNHLFAQKNFHKNERFATVGLGVSGHSCWIVNQNTYGEPELDYSPKYGLGIYASIGMNFNFNWGLKMEFTFNTMGQNYDGYKSQNTIYIDRKIDLNYIHIPLMLKYSFGKESLRFYFMAGPALGILHSASQSYKQKTGNSWVDSWTYYNPEIHEFIDVSKHEIWSRYKTYNIVGILDFGADILLSRNFFINTGIRLQYTINDINATQFQLLNNKGVYEPSHNFTGGVVLGIHRKINY